MEQVRGEGPRTRPQEERDLPRSGHRRHGGGRLARWPAEPPEVLEELRRRAARALDLDEGVARAEPGATVCNTGEIAVRIHTHHDERGLWERQQPELDARLPSALEVEVEALVAPGVGWLA